MNPDLDHVNAALGKDTANVVEVFRAARQDNLRASRCQRLGRVRGGFLVDLIRRAKAGERRARLLAGRDHVVLALEAVVRHGLDAAGLEEVLCECRARGELGDVSKIGEEHLGPCAGLLQHAVGGVAQLLERFREAHGGQRRKSDRR